MNVQLRLTGLLLVYQTALALPQHAAQHDQGGSVPEAFRHYKDAWNPMSVRTAHDATIQLTANISSFRHSPAPVLIQVAGVKQPRNQDCIAVYVPAGVDVTATVPIHYVNLTSLAGSKYLDTGVANVTLSLINMRGSFSIKLVQGGMLEPTIVASTADIPNKISNAPTSGHMALHADGRSLVIQWVSGQSSPQKVRWKQTKPANGDAAYTVSKSSTMKADSTTASSDTRSCRLMRGLQKPPQLSHLFSLLGALADAWPWGWTMAASEVSTYRRDDMCGFPANSTGWLDPGFLHTAVISADNLMPFSHYSYQYGSSADGWSQLQQFTAPPPAGYQGSVKFLVFNDVCQGGNVMFYNPPGSPFYDGPGSELRFADGYGRNSMKLPAALIANESDADLALLVGDLAYAVGYGADWDVFGQQFERVFTQWPLMTGTGNHERDMPGTSDAFNDTSMDSGGECNVPYTRRYYTPAVQKYNDPRISYYSFQMGPVHLLVLDSESPSHAGSLQGRFVEADLAAVDRTITPWLVVGMHRMMYAPATFWKEFVGDLNNMRRLQADLEELFRRYEVDVVVQGHEHAYARTCKLYRHACVETGPVYVLAGHAGAGFTHGFPKVNMPTWVEKGLQDKNGYLRFNANATSLLMEAVSTDDGSVMDQLSLSKKG